MRTFVLGDSHGAYRAFLQVMERSGFDYENDKLICLGDVADGWTEVPELIEELLKIKNLVWVQGNHDQWLKHWLKDEKKIPDVWSEQGGLNTLLAYDRKPELKEKHYKVLKALPCYYLDEENRLFVHGGFKPGVPLPEQDKMVLMWDRNLWHFGRSYGNVYPEYRQIYVGHTSIYGYGYELPTRFGNVWFMDTGGGMEGVLSLMDIETNEVFQSDLVRDLYPGVIGRNIKR